VHLPANKKASFRDAFLFFYDAWVNTTIRLSLPRSVQRSSFMAA